MEPTKTKADLDRERGKLIDTFVVADEFLTACQGHDMNHGPTDPEIAERLAIRLLVKHFDWIMAGPGDLRKHKRGDR